MRTDPDKIKKIFSSKLSNLEQDVPAHIWERIAEQLPQNEVVIPAKKTSIVRRISVAASVAAALILALLLLNEPGDEKAKQIVDNFNIDTLNPATTSVTKQPTHSEPEQKNTAIYAYTPKKSATIAVAQSESQPAINMGGATDEKLQEQPKQNTGDKSVRQSTTPDDLEKKIQEFAKQGEKVTSVLTSKHTDKKTGFALAFEGNTGFSRDNSKGTVTNSLRKTSSTSDVYNSNNPKLEYLQDKPKDVDVKYDHRQPISFGLLVSKDITPRLSLETGIAYTYVSSRIHSDKMSSIKRQDFQSFYYLGIPVTLNYNFASLGKTQFYGSVGGMIQKDISGHYSEEQISIENKSSNVVISKQKIHQSKPQVSIASGVGATYPIYDKLHIYTTVGGAYFIDANNKYRTIYSDRKFQLDLNVGLKMKF